MSDDPASIEAWQQQHDVVYRLRQIVNEPDKWCREDVWAVEHAADEIRRLRAELASRTDELNRLKDAAIQLRIADEEICNVKKSTREVFDRLEEAEAALDAIIGFEPPTRKNKEQP